VKDDPLYHFRYCASVRRRRHLAAIQRDLEHIERAKRPLVVHPVNVRDSNAISVNPPAAGNLLGLCSTSDVSGAVAAPLIQNQICVDHII